MATYYELKKDDHIPGKDNWEVIDINPIKKFPVKCEIKFDSENGVCIIRTKDSVYEIVREYFYGHTIPMTCCKNIYGMIFEDDYSNSQKISSCCRIFESKSFCNKEEDTFNYDTGYKIAEKRMKDAIRKEIVHVYKNVLKRYCDINDVIFTEIHKLSGDKK